MTDDRPLQDKVCYEAISALVKCTILKRTSTIKKNVLIVMFPGNQFYTLTRSK